MSLRKCRLFWPSMSQGRVRAAVAAAVIGLLCGSAMAVTNPPAVTKANDQFFDWQVNTTPSYLSSPFLTNSSASSVDAFLKSLPSNVPHAIKITGPINNSTANLIFNNAKYHVSYVFGDFESASATNQLKTLVNQVHFVNGQNNGTKSESFNSYVGNFAYTPTPSDPSKPSNVQLPSSSDFSSIKLNMSMPALYPGAPDYRSVAAGNSSAPNIRTDLFVLPVLRLTAAAVNSSSGQAVVPYLTRFNNWGNLALDTDRNASNGFKFVPGVAMPAKNGLPAVKASDTANQMLSQRDFATQVLTDRLRGATSYVNFSSGVVGYDNEQERKDAKTGWDESHVDAIFKASDFKLLMGSQIGGSKDLNDDMVVDGKNKSDESSGAMYSGVYSLSLKKMDVLITNMDDDNHKLSLPSKIDGFSLKTNTFAVDGGESLLIEYKLTNSGPAQGWSVAMQPTQPFIQLPNGRNEIGIPEPTTISLAAVSALIAVSRRRERADRNQKRNEKIETKPLGLIGMNMPGDVFVL